jgi:hypothetical protein
VVVPLDPSLVDEQREGHDGQAGLQHGDEGRVAGGRRRQRGGPRLADGALAIAEAAHVNTVLGAGPDEALPELQHQTGSGSGSLRP